MEYSIKERATNYQYAVYFIKFSFTDLTFFYLNRSCCCFSQKDFEEKS